jgi:hypothetical protein
LLLTTAVHLQFAILQVTLAAAGASGTKAKVTVKSPAFGAAGGANLVQTIFSDYAPSPMPVDEVSLLVMLVCLAPNQFVIWRQMGEVTHVATKV